VGARFAALLLLAGCSAAPAPDPITPFLPALPPTGGPPVAVAGLLDPFSYGAERVPGPASQGLLGDLYMRNDVIRLTVQSPGRAIGPCPWGGNVIDADFLVDPAEDQLGEVAPFLQLGRTVNFDRVEITRDGSQGGPAVLRLYGHDALDDYINVTGLGGFTEAIQSDYRADVDLGLEVAVTYVLQPGASALDIYYTFYNPGPDPRATTFGTITDTGAQIEIFHPGLGFGELQAQDLLDGSKPLPPIEYSALLGQGIAYGIVPLYDDPGVRGAPFPVAGVDVELYDVAAPFDAIGPKGQSLVVPPRGAVTRHVQLVLAREAGGVEAAVRQAKRDLTRVLAARVRDGAGQALAGARVTVEETSGASPRLVTTLTADGAGRAATLVVAGQYRLTAEGPGWLRSTPVDLVVGAADQAADLTVATAAPLDYTIHDNKGLASPGKVIVVGAPANAPDRRFRDVTKDALPLGIAGWIASLHGDSSSGTRFDHPIPLAPGRYRVVIGRGPEWSRFEQTLDVPASGARVAARLGRVLDTAGYVACDFHQHTHVSPDSPVPPSDRVVTYLAEGVELVSTSEHDVHLDYKPFIGALGAGGLMDSMIGVEVTPFDYGHFIGYPLQVNPLSPNGGALDWGGGDGPDLAPADIFAGLRALGARVVQVNHPRAAPGADVISTFQQTFDRAGLAFDFAGRSFGGSATVPLPAAELGLPDGAELFSPKFDALEVYNGVSYRAIPDGDSHLDPVTDNCLRDWMNFLSFGFTPTAVGDSDSHTWLAAPAGLPRTMVRVGDDSVLGIEKGVADDVVEVVSGLLPRDVVVTNTPMMALTVDGTTMGQVAQHQGGPLAIAVRVQTPEWAPVDTVEVFANATFDVPPPKGAAPAPLAPALCWTNRALPSPRCQAAEGGARPLAWRRIAVADAARLEATLTAQVDPAALNARVRAGATGQDLWMVARATGDVGLFPTIPQGVVDPADVPRLVEGAVPSGIGVGALAFTNPVFVDVDGGGWKAPFAP
jgi:hypothetical protein